MDEKKPKQAKSGNGQNGSALKGRDKILQAAKRVFSIYPFTVATTRMIAQEAGVDHPLIHYHFGSKDKLFEAVSDQMRNDFLSVQSHWLGGLIGVPPVRGFPIYLDHILDYAFANPEPLQLLVINMGQFRNMEDVDDRNYIHLHLNRMVELIMEHFPINGTEADLRTFLLCFHNLFISFLGAQGFQAQILDLVSQKEEYRKWVKTSLLTLFLPWLERLMPITDEEE